MSGTTWPGSVAVIGAAGLIGSGVMAEIAVRGAADVVHAVDIRQEVVQAHLIDIGEAQILAGSTRTRLVAGPPADGAPVDIVYVAASAPEDPDGDRRSFLSANLALLRRLAPVVEQLAGVDGLVVMLSNPVDVLAECLVALTSLEREQVIGYSLNDSVRLRAAVSRELGIDPVRVTAWVIGEHGAGQVPLLDRVRVDGEVIRLDEGERERITADIDGWFARWSALRPGRSSGWTTPRGVVDTLESMCDGTLHPAVVSTRLFGSSDSFLGLPVRRVAGRMVVETGPLTTGQCDALARSAQSVRDGALAALTVAEVQA